MAWTALIFAGIFECIGVTGITKVNQSHSVNAYATLIGGFTLSFILLAFAMQNIGMGTAYAVWTGIGTVGATLIGMFIYGESKNVMRIFFIALIIASVVGLKLIS